MQFYRVKNEADTFEVTLNPGIKSSPKALAVNFGSYVCLVNEPAPEISLVYIASAIDPTGDLLLMEGPARYDWKHGIKQVTTGERISVTLRAMSSVCSDDCL